MVPTQTEFAHALAQPYSAIHSILKRRETIPQSQSEPTDADVVSHFRSLFSNQDRTAKIPALTPEALPALLNNAHNAPQMEARLVRWRCMIQDTGFASEVYQSYQIEDPSSSLSPEGGASQTATAEAQASYSAFGLDFSVPSASDAGKNSEAAAAGGNKARAQRRRENESLRERNVMYAVSVPGETAWARRAFGDANVVDDAGISVALDALNLAGDSTSSGGGSGSGSGSLNPFRHKTPIPEEAHVAGLLKFYDVDGASASLQVTQVIEAVGILESTPFRADDWADLGFAMPPNDGTSTAAAGSSTSKTQYHGPCLHVLFFTPLPPSTIPQVLTEARTSSSSAAAAGSESAVSSAPELRAQLVAYLAEALGGDGLAAEFLLLTLLARVHTRRNEAGSGSGSTAGGADGAEGLGIGGLSLNLFNVPEREVQQKEKPVSGDKTTATTTTTKAAAAAAVIPAAPLPKLSQTLRSLLPAVVDQSLALTHLNSREVSFAPRAGTSSSSDTGETLHAGRLQLTPGTLLLVDEVGMGEGGTLNEGGVRNLQTLSGVLRTRRLEYEYPFNRFAFEADLRCVVLSAGKSFLPVDVFVPLEGAAARVREGEDAKDKEEEEEAVAPSLDTLRLFRLFLLQARYGAFTIDERDGVAERISADFVEARKRAANVVAAAKQKGGSEKEATAEAAAVEGMATQEDLLRRMSIARLLALSRSESRLSVETWVRAGELDEARLERIRKLPIGRPAAASGGVGRTGAAVAAKVI